MNNIKAVAESARNLAKQYQSVLAIQDVLDKLGDIENYTLDANKRLAEAEAKRDEVRQQLAKAEVGLAQAREAEAKQHAANVASRDACELDLALARETAAAAREFARVEAEKEIAQLRAEATVEVQEAREIAAHLKQEIEGLSQRRDELKLEIAALADRLKV